MRNKTCLGGLLVLLLLLQPTLGEVKRIEASDFPNSAVWITIGNRNTPPLAPPGSDATRLLASWGVFFQTSSTAAHPAVVVRDIQGISPNPVGPPEYIWAIQSSGESGSSFVPGPLVVNFSRPLRRVGFKLSGTNFVGLDDAKLEAFDAQGRSIGVVTREDLPWPAEPGVWIGIEAVGTTITKVVIQYTPGEETVEGVVLDSADLPLGLFETYLPQFGDGISGHLMLQSSVTIVNVNNSIGDGTISLLDDDGQPLDVELDQESGTAFRFALAPFASRAFVTSGLAGGGSDSSSLISGFVKIESDVPVQATCMYRTYQEGELIAEASVESSRPVSTAVGRVERLAAANLDCAIALVNTSTEGSRVELELSDEGGVSTVTGVLTLAPRAHLAQFLSELFPSVTSDYRGSLIIRSSEPIACAILRTQNGVAISSLPLGSTERD